MTKGGTALVIELGGPRGKPGFGDRPMKHEDDEETGGGETDTSDLALTAMEAFMEALKGDDAKAALKAYSALPCPAEMGAEEPSSEE